MVPPGNILGELAWGFRDEIVLFEIDIADLMELLLGHPFEEVFAGGVEGGGRDVLFVVLGTTEGRGFLTEGIMGGRHTLINIKIISGVIKQVDGKDK